MQYVKTSDGLLINTNDSHYTAVLAARESQKETQKMYDQVQNLSKEVREFRELLAQVVTGINNG